MKHCALLMGKGFRESGWGVERVGWLGRARARAPGACWLPAANRLVPTGPQPLGTGPAPRQTALNWTSRPLDWARRDWPIPGDRSHGAALAVARPFPCCAGHPGTAPLLAWWLWLLGPAPSSQLSPQAPSRLVGRYR